MRLDFLPHHRENINKQKINMCRLAYVCTTVISRYEILMNCSFVNILKNVFLLAIYLIQ